MVLKRAISIYLALVAVSVTVQFTVWTIYASASDRANDTAGAIWTVLGWCMLAGLVMMVVTTFQEKQRSEGDSSTSARCCHMSNVLFYGTVLLALAFLPKLVRGPLGSTPERRNFLGCLVHDRHRGAGPLRGRGPPSLAHRLRLAVAEQPEPEGSPLLHHAVDDPGWAVCRHFRGSLVPTPVLRWFFQS